MAGREHRLRKKKDFENVYKKGRIIFGPLFNIRYVNNDLGYPRFAFQVSKKTTGSSVARNLIKRKLRAATRKLLSQYEKNFDIVIVVKAKALSVDYQDLKKELRRLLPDD